MDGQREVRGSESGERWWCNKIEPTKARGGGIQGGGWWDRWEGRG